MKNVFFFTLVMLDFITVKACKSKNDNRIPGILNATINSHLPLKQNKSLALYRYVPKKSIIII